MNIKGQITISRPYGGSDSYINITIEDDTSNIEFVDLEIGLKEFAEALTGMSNQKCDIELRGLENLGKKHEHDVIEFPMPEVEWGKRDSVAFEEAKKHVPDGWEVSSYFGSQTSFFFKEDKKFARANIFRYV